MKHDATISVTLKEITTISAGYPLRGSAEALESGNTSFVQLKNTGPEGIDWESVSRLTLPGTKEPKWLTPQDIIFSARGTRNFASALTDAPEMTVCSPHFFVLSIKDADKILPEFLAWQINQKPAQEYLKRSAVGTQAVSTIRRPALEALPVFVPPINEQKLIVKFYEAAKQEQAALQHLIANRTLQSDAIAYGLQTRAKETEA